MKYITAVFALIANVQAIEYAVSEGPTKADNSEADETVLPRTLDADGKWENPLSWHDNGADDDTVLTQIDTAKRHHKKHHKKHHHHKADAYDGDEHSVSAYDNQEQHKFGDWTVPNNYAQKRKAADVYRKQKDAYDLDPTTTSPYDDMYQHKKFDWGVKEGEPGSKGPWGQYHGTWVDMR